MRKAEANKAGHPRCVSLGICRMKFKWHTGRSQTYLPHVTESEAAAVAALKCRATGKLRGLLNRTSWAAFVLAQVRLTAVAPEKGVSQRKRRPFFGKNERFKPFGNQPRWGSFREHPRSFKYNQLFVSQCPRPLSLKRVVTRLTDRPAIYESWPFDKFVQGTYFCWLKHCTWY